MKNSRVFLAGCAVVALASLTACSASVSESTTSDASSSSASPSTAKPSPTQAAPADWKPAPGDKTVYLTFDDGPWHETSQVLDILKENGVHATFFQIGKLVRTRESTNARIISEGHAIGNHTQAHKDLATLDASEVRYQLERSQELIGPTAGPCMRPPFGSLNETSRKIAKDLGLTTVLWTRDTNDWEVPSKSAIASILAGTQPGDVVLMHDGGGDRSATVEALRQELPKLVAKGYKFDVVPVCKVPAN